MSGATQFLDDPILGDGLVMTSPTTSLNIVNSVDARHGQLVLTYSNEDGATLNLDVYIWNGSAWIRTGEVIALSAPDNAVAAIDYGCYVAFYGSPSSEGEDWYVRAGVRRG